MQRLVKFVSVLAGFVVFGGLAGALHPLGDALAVFRFPAGVVFALAVIWTDWPRRVRWPLALICLALLWPFATSRMAAPAPKPQAITLYQQNLMFSRRKDSDFLEAVGAARPDVLTLQEVSGRNQAILEALRPTHPAQILCPFAAVGGVAVVSRWPATGRQICAERNGMAALEVTTPIGPLWVVSIHLHWPFPYGQMAQVDALVPLLRSLEGPRVIAGDFNTMAWSHALRRIKASTGTERIGPLQPTMFLSRYHVPLGIDHVLAPKAPGQSITIQPRHGSDHQGVLARLAYPGQS